LQKTKSYKPQRSLLSLITTTHIEYYKQTADQINRIITNSLPVGNDKFMICEALDYINGVQTQDKLTSFITYTIGNKTNVFKQFFEKGICMEQSELVPILTKRHYTFK